MNIVNELIGATLQIALFALIPFWVYLFQKRKTKGFFHYLGLKKSTRKANLLAVLASILFAASPLLLTFFSEEFRSIMLNPNSATGKFNQMEPNIQTILLLLIIALFETALAEELFFRGFIAKRLIDKTGFTTGNTIQALIFGLIHVGLFAMATNNVFFLAVILLVPSMGAYVSGYLNEKLADGSILPGWISHALANVLSYGIVGFLV